MFIGVVLRSCILTACAPRVQARAAIVVQRLDQKRGKDAESNVHDSEKDCGIVLIKLVVPVKAAESSINYEQSLVAGVSLYNYAAQ